MIPMTPPCGGTDAAPVVLISMPFALVNRPSIQLGILRALLDREEIGVAARSYNLAFHDYLVRATRAGGVTITVDDDEWLNEDQLLGAEWMFAVPPYREPTAERDARYFQYLRDKGVPNDRVEKLVHARSLVPAFLRACADDVLRAAPKVVGFTTTFAQNVPSLVLAKILKQRDPSLTIVFGGANCDGPMGAALHRSFPWIDVVVRGEAELVFPALVRDCLEGRGPRPRSGTCVRDGEATVESEVTDPPVVMDDVPTPNYAEYFERLHQCEIRTEVLRKINLPVESARGCWWGQKYHCTFCGLNGSSMAFRSKSPERAAGDIVELARRHHMLRFDAVDNIVDMRYVRELLPELARAKHELGLFYETKSNLKRSELRAMRLAGVMAIQPGIESLSTPTLVLMKKGVTALQNLRLLKWCAEMRIHVAWNILYGFPGEQPEEYARMAQLIPSLAHLQPPRLVRVRVQRFSPYHQRPAAHGVRIVAPDRCYRHLYDLEPEALDDLAYFFEHENVDGSNPEAYVAPLREAIDHWGRARGFLTYQRGPGFLEIVDARRAADISRFVLEGVEAEIYLACDAGATPVMVARALGDDAMDVDDIEAFLRELAEAGLVFEERGRFLALANPYDTLRTLVAEELASAASAPPPEADEGVATRRRSLRLMGMS
jgi:ribosomal peptide maturation radical SAM protein 1